MPTLTGSQKEKTIKYLTTVLGVIAGGITGYAGTYCKIYSPGNPFIYVVWLFSCVTVPVGAIFGGGLVYLTFKLFSVKPMKDADRKCSTVSPDAIKTLFIQVSYSLFLLGIMWYLNETIWEPYLKLSFKTGHFNN